MQPIKLQIILRTVFGIVQFPPRESETKSGQAIRNIVVRQAGFKDNAIQVSATIWSSHEHVEVEEGDVVVLEGKFERNRGTNKDGESVTYNNLSVSKIAVLGTADAGVREETSSRRTSEPADDEDDDEIPF